MASETEEERAANQHHRLAAETGSEREARLQRNREGQRGQQSQLPLFEQPSVQAKMRKFHAEIAALEMQKCTTCSERFPAAPHQPHRTSRSSRACASIAFELTLAPTMLCIHLVHEWNRPYSRFKVVQVSYLKELSFVNYNLYLYNLGTLYY